MYTLAALLRTHARDFGARSFVWGLVGGIALVLAGAALVAHPILSVYLALALPGLVAALVGIRRFATKTGDPKFSALLIVTGLSVALFYKQLAPYVPVIAAVLLVSAGIQRGLQYRVSEGSAKLLALALALFNFTSAGLAMRWPDVAVIVVGVGFALTLVMGGAVLLFAAISSRRVGGVKPAQAAGQAHRGGWRIAGAVAVLGLVAGLGWLSFTLNSTNPRVTAFYTPPAEVPSEPGRLIAIEPYSGTLPAGADAFRILYTTTNSDDSAAIASALVAIPQSATEQNRTVLSWQHGTTGVAQACAPSLMDNALTPEAIPAINEAISRGWVVVATDYTGQGAQGRYPYLLGEGQGRSSVDAVRALADIPQANASKDVLYWGHSQGGHATLWAAQVTEEYAPELNLLGAAALSPASDPLALANVVKDAKNGGGFLAIVTAYVLNAYALEYDDIVKNDYIEPAARPIIDGAIERCTSSYSLLASAVTAVFANSDRPLLQLDLSEGTVLHTRLSENIPPATFDAPVLIAQGADDEVIPIRTQRDYVAHLCSEVRQDVDFREYPGKTHMGVIAEDSPLVPDLLAWSDEVVAGGEPAGSCS